MFLKLNNTRGNTYNKIILKKKKKFRKKLQTIKKTKK